MKAVPKDKEAISEYFDKAMKDYKARGCFAY